MTASIGPMFKSPAKSFGHSHGQAHAAGDRCPWCEQAIPRDKFAEIASRIAAKEREQYASMTKSLQERFQREKIEAEARAREDGRKAAETELSKLRESLEQEKVAAVLAEQMKTFEEKQRMQARLADLQKQIENKTAQELGEGPEADLFEQLRTAFEGDRIRRVLKGTQGADVIHEVVHNGRVCGKIVYNSKNRNAWKSDFVVKLRADQMAERAEHAILSSNKFPAGAQQLHIQDGVVIAHPGRVIVLAEVLRRHLVETHELRISNDEREEKTIALYAFITSDRCKQLFQSIELSAARMLELDAAEEKAHRLNWERRNKLIRGVQKVHGDLSFEIERVIGTAHADAQADAPLD